MSDNPYSTFVFFRVYVSSEINYEMTWIVLYVCTGAEGGGEWQIILAETVTCSLR